MKKEKCQKIGKSKWFHLVVYSILAFVFVLPVTVHATEKINRAADSYTVKLPKSVDVSKNSMTFDVLVENNENHNVYITMDNSVPLKNDKKPNESVPLQVAFENGVKFGVNERKTATLTHGDLNAGKWNASLNVNIKAEANKYIFKFDGNGATSGTMADIPSSFGKEFILPECAFTKEYYTFEHYNLYKIENGVKKYYYMKEGTLGDSSEYRKWYEKGKQPEGWTISFPIPGSDIYSKVYNINDGETLYIEAQWEANRLTINYHADGATKYKDPNDGEVIKDITGKDIILTKEYLHNVQYNNGFIDSNRFSGKDYFNTNTNNWKSNKDSTTSINASNSGTGKELAEDVGLDLSKGNITVDFYPDWQMNVGTMHFYPNSGNNKGYEGSTIIDSGEYAGSLSRLQGFNYKSTSGNTVLDVLTLFEKTGYHTSSIQAWHLGSANSNEYIKDNEEDLSRFVKDSTNVHLKLYANWIPNTYSVKYDGNGATSGSVANSSHTYDSAKVLNKNSHVKTGYTFLGWSTDKSATKATYTDGQSVKNLTTTNGGNVTLYAVWEANTYTYNIKYVSSSGKSLGTSTVAGTYGSSKEVTPPAMTGYTSPAAQTVKFDSVNAKTITFTYPIIDYKITYTLNGGAISGNPASYNVESEDITLKNPVKTGHTFTGWTGSNGSTPQKRVTITSGSTGNKTYTANYSVNTYKATFDANGGSNPNPAFISKTYGSQLGNLPISTKTGYTFDGWYTSKSGGTKISATTTMGASDVTYYAHWRANKLTVNYYPNGGTPTGTDFINNGQDKPMFTQTGTYGSKWNADHGLHDPTSTRITRIGYTQKGYNTQANGSGRAVDCTHLIYAQDIEPSLKDGDRTLNIYVQWTPNTYTYNIKYVSSSGKSLGTSTVAGTYGSSKEVTPPAMRGYTSPAAQTVKFDSTSAKTITFTYTPVTYSITYNLGGGSVSGNPTSYNIESAAITLKNPTRTGYTFTGWTGNNGTTPQTSVSIPSGSTGNKSYTANWKINTYTLTYNANGGSVTPTSKTLTYGSQYGTLPTPTRTGYTFNGWYTAASGGTKVSSTTTIGASNTTIYAHWTKKLTYELVDGPTFNSKLVALMNKHLSVAEWEIIFTDQKSSGTLIHDFDKDGDGGIVAWVDENELIKAPMKGTVYISTQNSGQKVIANENSREMFAYRQKLTSLDVSNLDTSKVTDMSYMLAGSGFTSLDLSNFNTSNVTNMQQMFSNSYSLTSLDISNFNTSKVTNMLGMFKDNFSLTTLNLSNFNTSNVTNMGSMFNGCVKLTTLNLSNFNTSKVTNMNSMFSGCEKLTTLNLSNFNTSNVTNMNSMFNGCIELSSSITIMNPTITNYSEMFTNCSTASNSKFIVNYIDNTTKSVARKMVATKSYNSKVFLY